MAETDLAVRLKEARLATGFIRGDSVSQEQMAELVSAELGRTLHPTQWRRYESGGRQAPLEVIAAAAAVSGLDPAYIAFGGQRPTPIAGGFQSMTESDEEKDADKRRRQ